MKLDKNFLSPELSHEEKMQQLEDFQEKNAKIHARTKKISKKVLRLAFESAFFLYLNLSGASYINDKIVDSHYIEIDGSDFDKDCTIDISRLSGYNHGLGSFKDIYTLDEISQIGEISINLRYDTDLSWIKYFKNLTHVIINVDSTSMDGSSLNHLKTLSKLNWVTINCDENSQHVFNEIDFGVLRDLSINTLTLNGLTIEREFLPTLSGIKDLYLEPSIYSNVDYSHLTNFKNIHFYQDNIEDLAIGFTIADYIALAEAGVKIDMGDNSSYFDKYVTREDKWREQCAELDNIISSNNIPSNNQSEAIRLIIKYILNHYEYDSATTDAMSQQIDPVSEKNYYENGYLTGSVNKTSAICGNYATLFTALCNRVGIDSYIISSNTHMWNMVNMMGNYFYIDVSVLAKDKEFNLELIDSYLLHEDRWYFKSVKTANKEIENETDEEIKEMYTPINLPNYIGLDENDEIIYDYLVGEPLTKNDNSNSNVVNPLEEVVDYNLPKVQTIGVPIAASLLAANILDQCVLSYVNPGRYRVNVRGRKRKKR